MGRERQGREKELALSPADHSLCRGYLRRMDGSPGHLEALGWKLMLSLRASVSAPRISPVRELGLIHSCYVSLGGSLHLSEFSADSLSVDILKLKEGSLSSPGLANFSRKGPESFGSSGCQEQEQLYCSYYYYYCLWTIITTLYCPRTASAWSLV